MQLKMAVHLGEEVLLKAEANGKAGKHLEGDLLALLHEDLQVSQMHIEKWDMYHKYRTADF